MTLDDLEKRRQPGAGRERNSWAEQFPRALWVLGRPTSRDPFVALVVVLLLAVVPVLAQEVESEKEPPQSVVEDEVTVSAQRVEQALQDVPISIVVYDGEELEQQAITDVQRLADATPGLVVSGQAGSTGEVSLFIRGIGSNTFGLGTESTVGYYVDGVYIPRSQGFLNQFLDVERVEVLRGPQGTLWGRNSTGGAVNVVTRLPESTWRGRVFGEYSDFNSPRSADGQRLALSLTGPLSERVHGRVSASRYVADDYTLNEALSRQHRNLDGYGVRAALTLLPSDALALTLRADHTDDASHNNFVFKSGVLSPISTLGTLSRFFGLTNPPDVHRIAANIPPVSEYEESGFALHLDWVLNDTGTSLESISSYRDLESVRGADVDATTLDFVENFTNIDGEWWSQEIKLTGSSDRLDWITGAYFFHEEGRNLIDTRTDLALFQVHFFASNPGLFLFDPATFCHNGPFAPPDTLCGLEYYTLVALFVGLDLPGNKSSGNFFDTLLDTDSLAAYAQLYWHATDRLTVTGGLRLTEDQKTHSQTAIDFITLEPLSLAQDDDWGAATPKLGLEYRPNEDVMVYGSVTTGFKSGGFNSISLQPSFDEETITSYEVGVKSTLAERKVVLNAAAFHYDYHDLQVAVLFPDGSRIENAAEASVTGLDLDVSLRPNHRFEAQIGVELLDDEFDTFMSQDPLRVAQVRDALNAAGIFDQVVLALAAASVPASNLSGNGLPRASDFSASVALQYVLPLRESGSMAFRAQYRYTDDVAFDPFANFVQQSYELIDAGVTWTAPNGRWFVSFFGRNLTDEEYVVSELFTSFTGSLRVWAPPRQIGVQTGLEF